MKKTYRKTAHFIRLKHVILFLWILSLVSCNKPALHMDQRDRKYQEETEAKREADGKAWAEQIGSKAAEKAASQEGFDQFWNEHIKSPKYQKQQARLQRVIQQTTPRRSDREPVLFINTGPGAFEPSEILYRNDVYSYDCLTKEITFRDGTSGYYPEALEDRDAR